MFTRCVFFRSMDTTLLERQVNYFLRYAPLAALHKKETIAQGEVVIVTLWIEPMPHADTINEVYNAAVGLGSP